MLQRQALSFTRLHSCSATEEVLHKNYVQTKWVWICSVLLNRPLFDTPVLDFSIMTTAFVLSSHLLLGLPNLRFRRTLNKIFCAFFVSSVLATCSTHRRLLDFKTTLHLLRITQICNKPSQFSLLVPLRIRLNRLRGSLSMKYLEFWTYDWESFVPLKE
jgi:hypothetical protein